MKMGVIALILAASAVVSAISAATALGGESTVRVPPGYFPNPTSVELWIAEATRLSGEIARREGDGAAKKKRFGEVFRILIGVGYGFPDYIGYYRNVLMSGKDPRAKVIAAALLEALKDEKLDDILRSLMADRQSPEGRFVAFMYCRDIKDGDMITFVEGAVAREDDIRVRIAGINTLKNLREAE